MKNKRLLVVSAFTGLLVIATIIGCTGTGGILFPASVTFAFVSSGNYDGSDSNITITPFKVDPTTGALTATGSPVPTGDDFSGASFIDAAPGGRFVFAPLPASGAVAVFSVDQSSGALTPVAGSPFTGLSEPYVVKVHPNGKFLYVSDYGNDAIAIFSIGSGGGLTAVGTPVTLSFSPQQMVMDPAGRFLYVTPACCSGSTVEAFAIDGSTGALTATPGSPFDVCGGEQCRSGVIDSSGKFLILGETWTSQVHVLSIAANGDLTEVATSPVATESGPFNPILVTSGGATFLAANNLYDATLSVFEFNTSTGELTEVADSPFTNPNWSWPHYLVVDPQGKFVYVVDTDDAITAFQVSSSGAGTEISGSPFGTSLLHPINMVITH